MGAVGQQQQRPASRIAAKRDLLEASARDFYVACTTPGKTALDRAEAMASLSKSACDFVRAERGIGL